MSITNYEICHRWANKREVRAYYRSFPNNNVFYDNSGRIYSYGSHFCMARLINDVVFYTLERYSNSTAKHQNEMLSASRQYTHIACAVQGRRSSGYYSSYSYVFDVDTPEFQQANFDAWKAQIEEQTRLLQKARKPEKYLAEIAHICRQASDFADACKCKLPILFRQFVNASNLDAVKEYARKEAARAERMRAKEEKEREIKFQNFEISSYRSDYQTVRLNEKSNRFETSLAVQIPFEIGKRFYNALKAGEIKIGDSVLYYDVRSLKENVIKIGCHNFKKSYLLKYGKAIFETA